MTDPDVQVHAEKASDGDYQISLIDNASQMYYNFLPLETSLHDAKLKGLELLRNAVIDIKEQQDEAAKE